MHSRAIINIIVIISIMSQRQQTVFENNETYQIVQNHTFVGVGRYFFISLRV